MKIVRKDSNDFYLSVHELEEGKLYECDNETFCIVVTTYVAKNARVSERVINIENGVGGYELTQSKFRPVTNSFATLETDSVGNII